MAFYINQRVRDPSTGDYGRIVMFRDGKPVARTRGGKVMHDFVPTSGGGPRPPIVDRYFAFQEMKACNCAGCKKELLSREHEVEVDHAIRRGEDVSGLPPFVAGYLMRKDGHRRPYCQTCYNPLI